MAPSGSHTICPADISRFLNDLSLITGPDMPQLSSPTGVVSVVGWARYEDALDGQPVFTCLFNAWNNKLKILEGKVAVRATQQAVVVGSEYLWLKKFHSQSVENRDRLAFIERLVGIRSVRWEAKRLNSKSASLSELRKANKACGN